MVSRGFHGMVDSRQLDCPKVSTMSPHTCQLCPRSKHKATKKRSKESAFKTRAHKLTQRAVSAFLAPQKHGARQNDGCVKPSFSRILTRTRFAPYALGQALLPRKPARHHALLVLHRF